MCKEYLEFNQEDFEEDRREREEAATDDDASVGVDSTRCPSRRRSSSNISSNSVSPTSVITTGIHRNREFGKVYQEDPKYVQTAISRFKPDGPKKFDASLVGFRDFCMKEQEARKSGTHFSFQLDSKLSAIDFNKYCRK